MAPVDPSELLAHAAWLRRLARSLLHEGADDVVQDTWIAALRRPPEANRSVRPWLRAVLLNVVRLRWRSDTHRSAREQVAAALTDDAAPSSARLLERHELQQLLARLVGELGEPFRSTILLRFAEGLTPTQIARRLDVPASTVRWRLKEALARLRMQLDALHRGDRHAWLAAFAPVALPQRQPGTPVIALAVVGAAACTLAVVAWFALAGGPPSSTIAAPERGTTAAQARRTMLPPAAAWLAQEGAPPRALTGRVLLGGAPASGALVRLVADPLPSRDVKANADGRFDFGELPPRAYVVSAALPGKLAVIQHVDLRDPTATHDLELVLGDCVASIYGKVTDASGTPIARAEVLREGVIGGETDAAGNYDVCVLPTAALVAEIRLVVRADGFGTLAIAIAPTGRVHQDFVLAPEATVAGRVIGGGGATIANARVALELTHPEAAEPPERGVYLAVVSEDDGRFRISGLATGEYRLAATSSDAITSSVTLKLAAGESRDVELRAVPTGVVRGRVTMHGRALAGVTVAAGNEGAISQHDGSFVLARVPVGDVELATTPYRRTSGVIHIVAGDHTRAEITVEPLGILRGTIRRNGAPVPFARVDIAGPSRAGVTADAAGRYEARGLEPGTYGYYCDDRRLGAMFTAGRVVELGLGEVREQDIELDRGGTIAGHVVDAHGDPVARVEVRFRAGGTSHCMTDEAGAFRCSGLAGDTYNATVFPGSGAAHAFRFVEPPPKLELRDGYARIDGVRLVIKPALLAIEGTVIDGYGAPVPDAAVHALDPNGRPRKNFLGPPSAITDADGRFRIAELSPGDYHVEVEHGAHAARRTVAAGASVALVLDRSPCDAARGHELPAAFVRAPARVVWNQQIELVGWSLPATATLDAPFEMTLVYRALKPIDSDWTIFAHFDSPAHRNNADHAPGTGWCPTSQWKAGETIVDRATVNFTRAGRYALRIGFFTGRAPDWVNLPLSITPERENHGAHIANIVVE